MEKIAAQTDIVADEVEVVARSEGHGGSAPLGQTGVGLVQRLVDEDEGVDRCLSVRRRSGEVGVRQGHHVRGHVLQKTEGEKGNIMTLEISETKMLTLHNSPL